MNVTVMKVLAVLSVAAILGCSSVSKPSTPPKTPTAQLEGKSRVQQKPQRQWNKTQLELLRTFALQESPELWQTVQALRAERESRMAGLKKLRAELIDFGRNPDEDPDYVALKAANDGLLDSLNAIFMKLEDAYIAYKKFEATPSRREYGDVMRKVLADGLLDASEAEKRYIQMSRTK